MFYLRRTLAAIVIGLATFPACAFTFSYGDLLAVKDVKNKNGVLQLPLTRKKYKNVKILSKELYDFLKRCSADCRYDRDEAQLEMAEFRPAESRRDMWIADVAFNKEMLVTFLVFQNKEGLSVKFPETVIFKDRKLKEQVKKYITDTAAQKV